MADQYLNIGINFKAETQQAKANIKDLQNSLNQIIATSHTDLTLNANMREAVASAKELQMHLNNAFNMKTGNLDLSKLNASLRQSNTNLATLGQGLLKAGVQGEQAFMNIQRSLATANVSLKKTNGLISQMATTLSNTIRWQLASGAIHGFMGAMQSAVSYAQDLDKSLNEIRIVTGQSTEQMADFAKEANKAAKALSTTTTEYTNASLIYYQQGLSTEEVKKRTDITIKMANVAGESAETVSDQLTAVWNNFADGTKSLEYYADVMTALGAATASSVDEISGGLEKFAAIGETIGLSYEYAASALATITSNTRQSEEVVGTALKTIFARIQGLKLGETQDDGTTLNKYSQALASVGISIFEANGELKNMDNILNEMAAKWDTLNKAQQTALAQTVAGVRQYTQLVALMENWDNGDNDSMTANLNTSYMSEGALQQQSEIYAESWEAAADRAKASLETLYNELIPTDFIIDLTNATSDILDVISALVDGFGGIGNILLLLTNIMLHKFAPSITTGINSGLDRLQIFASGLTHFKDRMNDSATASSKLKTNLNELNAAGLKGAEASSKYLEENLNRSGDASLRMSANMNQTALQTKGLTQAFQEYINDTNQVYGLQDLINKNANNLTKAEQERLSIMQKQLLVLASEKENLASQLEIIKQQRNQRILRGNNNLYENELYSDLGVKNKYSLPKGDDTASRIAYSKVSDEEIKFFKNSIFQDIAKQTTSDGTTFFASSSLDGIQQAGSKALSHYSELDSVMRKISGTLSTINAESGSYTKKIMEEVQGLQKANIISKEQVNNIEKQLALDKKLYETKEGRSIVEGRVNGILNGQLNIIRRIASELGLEDVTLDRILLDNEQIAKLEAQSLAKTAEWKQQTKGVGDALTQNVAKFQTMGATITKGAQGFSTLAMGFSMVSNAFQTLNDDTATFGAKISSVGFALPMLIQSIETLRKGYQFLATTVKLANIEKITTISLTETENALIALNNLILDRQNKKITERELLINSSLILKKLQLTDEEKGIILQALKNGLDEKEIKNLAKKIYLQKASNIEKLKSLGILAAVVIAIAAVVAITKALINAYNKEEEANKRAQEQLQATNQTLSNTKQKYQEVIDTIEKYEESVKALENIRKGTEEWDEAVQQLNSDVLELLKSYSGLAQYVSEDKDGVLSISDEGLEWLEEQQRQAVNKAEVASYNAAIAANNAEDDWNTTRIARSAGMSTTTLEQGVKALQVDPTLYASQGAELYDRISQALYGKDYMAGEETAGVIVAIANAQEEVTNLANELKANTKANEILGKQVSESYLKQSDEYLGSDEDAQNAANLLLTNKLAEQDFDNRYGSRKETYRDYASYMGWDVAGTEINKKEGYAEYTLADGSTEKVYLDIARQALNQQEYVDSIQNEIDAFINSIDNLERNIKTADDYQAYKSALTKEGLAAGLTQDQITSVLYDSEDAGRFAKIDDITNEMLKKGLTSGISTELFQQSLDELSDEELSLAIDVLPSSDSVEEFKDNLHEAIIIAGREEIENTFAAGEEELGISAEALESYAETLMATEYQQKNFNELSQEQQRQYIENAKAAADAAVANYRLAIGINKIQKAFNDNIDVLNEANEASLDYHEAIGELTIAMKETFGMKVDAKFVKENLSLIKEMATGSEEALVELRNKLNEDFILKLEFEDNTLNQELLTTLEQLQQAALDNPVGTTLQLDNEKAISALNEALITGQATIEDIQAMFNNANLQMPEYKTKSIPGDAVTSHSNIEFTGPLGMTWKASSKTTTTTDRVVPYFGDNAPEVDDDGNITSYGGGGSLAVTTSGPSSMSDLNEIIEYGDDTDSLQDDNFDNLQKKLELKLQIDEDELERLEYFLDKYADDFYLLGESAETLWDTFEHRENILETHKAHIADLTAAYNAGQISAEDYNSGLEESKDAIYDQLNALLDLDKQMREYYGNTLDEADTELEDHTDHLQHLSKVFDHYINLMDIFGKSKDYDAMGNFLQGQADVIKNDLDVMEDYYDGLVQEKEIVKKLLDEAIASGNQEKIDYYTNMYDDISDKVDDTQEKMLEKTEEWAEAMKKVFENTFNKLSDELEKALTDGMGFESMLDDFDLLNQQQEEFLTKTNQIYETNKLMRTATKAMDDTSNKAAKQKIKNYIEETKKLQNTTRLSKYELEIQQAKYDLLLAEIALEEAQNTKSTVRLSRDNEGNFGYVYTADQDEVDNAQQQLEDAQNNLYNIQYEGQQNALTKYVEALQDYKDAVIEVEQNRLDGEYTSEEEYRAELARLEEAYRGPTGILTELARLYNITLQENTNATAENMLNKYGYMTDGVENHANLVQQFIGDMDNAWNEFQNALTQVHDEVQTALGDSEQATKDLTDEGKALSESIREDVVPAIQKEIDQVREAVSAYGLQRDAILDLINQYEKYIDELDKVIAKQAELANSGGSQTPEDLEGLDDIELEDTTFNSSFSPPQEGDIIWTGRSENDASGRHMGYLDGKWVVIEEELKEGELYRINGITYVFEKGKLIKRNYKPSSTGGPGSNVMFDTGGYTGNWGPEGKLAMLHEKELVLNASDTENILSAVSMIREIVSAIDSRAQMSSLMTMTSTSNVASNSSTLEQSVMIEASFPNATDRYEIEEAFNNLVNQAAQYAHRK